MTTPIYHAFVPNNDGQLKGYMIVKTIVHHLLKKRANGYAFRVAVQCALLILFFAVSLFGQASIGGLVWMDENKNGIREATERGFSGVLVELYQMKDEQFSLVGAQRTASNGHYLYILSADLLPGRFYLQFESAAGLRFSPADVGDDETKDSDVDPTTGRTPIIEIDNGYNANYWGAGYYAYQEIVPQDTTTPPPPPPPITQQKQADLSLTIFADKNTVHVGDTLYYTVQVKNMGPDTAVQVQMVMPWSSALQLLKSNPMPQDILSNPLVWLFADIPPDSTLQILFSAQVINGGVLAEPACIASQTLDNNLSNNCQLYQIDIETPVELVAFTATRRNNGVLIRWVTQSEKENMGFYLYRSQTADGGYERLNEKIIPGHGTTAIKHSYEYIDEAVIENTTLYYKLQDIDYSGRMVTHGPISVSTSAPGGYALLQNYPNPFNSSTKIEFELPAPGRVELAIYNSAGQLIRTLLLEDRPAGYHCVSWDGLDSTGMPVSSGVYIYVLKANGYQQFRKMQILR